MLDIVIRGVSIVDGTGSPARTGDIGITGSRIVAVGTVDDDARSTIDGSGQVAAPGFVDIHTHYDAQIEWDPLASPSPLHGVTTVVGGNCGFTLASVEPDDADFIARLMARVEGIPLAAIEAGVSWGWRDFADWLGCIDRPLGVNAGFLVGHSALRRAVLGERSGEPASDAEITAMTKLLAGSLAAGGLGLSSSQSPTHNDGDGRPVPSRHAEARELIALAGEVGRHAGTTLELIPGSFQRIEGFSDDDVELMIAMSLAADRPVNWNLLKVSARRPERHEAQLAVSDVARRRGAEIVASPCPTSSGSG